MRKCHKDPLCGIFLKRGLFKDIKDISPVPSLFICPVFIAELKPSLLLSSFQYITHAHCISFYLSAYFKTFIPHNYIRDDLPKKRMFSFGH